MNKTIFVFIVKIERVYNTEMSSFCGVDILKCFLQMKNHFPKRTSGAPLHTLS